MINATTSSLVAGYTRQSARSLASRNSRPEHAPEQPRQTQKAVAPRSQSADASAALGNALSPAEREMIGARFPESPRMSLRLYGPARPSGLAPTSVGSLLDIKG